MPRAVSKERKETVWDKIDLSQLKTAILSLGDRMQELNTETWRLDGRREEVDSIWNQLGRLLNLETSESTRRSLYNIWKRNRHQIQQMVAMERTDNEGNEEIIESETISATSDERTALQAVISSPIGARSKRAGLRSSNANDSDEDDENSEYSILFSAVEWKAAFSRTHQEMKSEWTNIFRDKLKESGFVCTLKFRTPMFKRGDRKKNCRFFCCYGQCTTKICARKFHIVLQQEPTNPGTPLLFLIRTFGKENHDGNVETAAVPLKGAERELVGLYFFREGGMKTSCVCFQENVPTRLDQ